MECSASPELERWLPVPGWEGLYEYSTEGRVRSLDRTLRDGRRAGGVILKQTPNSKGYPCVTLSGGGHRVTVPVYKLIKQADTGPSRGRQVRHLDDDKLNSAPRNLKYGDRTGKQTGRTGRGTGRGD